MLTWVSVMNQATAVVISTFGIQRVQVCEHGGLIRLRSMCTARRRISTSDSAPHVRAQFHDWHGTMSLLYLPPEVRIKRPPRLIGPAS